MQNTPDSEKEQPSVGGHWSLGNPTSKRSMNAQRKQAKRSSNNIDLLLEHDYGISKATGILSKLFRILLFKINPNLLTWVEWTNRYIADPSNRIKNSPRDRNSVRGNLNKELQRPNFTFKIFMKAMKWLPIKWVKFTVTVCLDNNRTHDAEYKVYTRGVVIEEEDD